MRWVNAGVEVLKGDQRCLTLSNQHGARWLHTSPGEHPALIRRPFVAAKARGSGLGILAGLADLARRPMNTSPSPFISSLAAMAVSVMFLACHCEGLTMLPVRHRQGSAPERATDPLTFNRKCASWTRSIGAWYSSALSELRCTTGGLS